MNHVGALVLLCLVVAAPMGCSSVQHLWVQPGYNVKAPAAVKRIVIAAWAPKAHPGLADVMRQVAVDRVSLRLNYLVYQSTTYTRGWSDVCQGREGVLSLRALGVQQHQGTLTLTLAAELHHCQSGALLWRSQASSGTAMADDNLAALTASYVENLGEEVRPYAAPVFLILRDMLDVLPDPILSDDEIMEKIEMGDLGHLKIQSLAATSAFGVLRLR